MEVSHHHLNMNLTRFILLSLVEFHLHLVVYHLRCIKINLEEFHHHQEMFLLIWNSNITEEFHHHQAVCLLRWDRNIREEFHHHHQEWLHLNWVLILTEVDQHPIEEDSKEKNLTYHMKDTKFLKLNRGQHISHRKEIEVSSISSTQISKGLSNQCLSLLHFTNLS